MQELNMSSSVNNLVSFALLVAVTYFGTAAAVRVVATCKDKYKRRLKDGKLTREISEENDLSHSIKRGLRLASPAALSIGFSREVISDFYDENNHPYDETNVPEQCSQIPLNRDEKTVDTESQAQDVARKLIDELIRACTEARKDRNLKQEAGITDLGQGDDLPKGKNDLFSPLDESSSDQTSSPTITTVSSLITCDSDCSSVTSGVSSSTERDGSSESCGDEATINDLVATRAYSGGPGDNSTAGEVTKSTTQLQEANTSEKVQECAAIDKNQQVETSMEACALQNLGETFEYQQIHDTDLEVEQIKREGTDEMLYNSRRDSTGVEYDMQLMAMEEEMRRNAEEIAKTGDEVLNNNEITGVDEDTAAEDAFPGAMAPILEEEEEETESGSFCEHGTDNNVVTSPDASPAATTHQTDTSVEATSSGDKDNSCTTTNTTCATRDDALEVAAKQNSANKSLNIVVTKADVHAENTDGAQRVGGADCVTSCSQSLGNGVCYSAGACRHNNGGGDGSDGDCVVSGEHSLQTVKTENTEQTVDKPTGEMGQCASVAADNIDKETNYVAENTSNAVKPEQNKGSGLTDLHGSTQNESNTSQPQSGHASVISVTPARDVEKSDVAKLSESKTAEFPQVDTALKETEKTENSKAGTKTQADTSKIPPSSFEFYGVRPKESTPTACSITARMRCLHTGSHTGDKLAVVEDGDTCDLEIFVKVLEGLALGKTKIYIKICLESEEPNYKRIKRKTKAMKCASPLQLSKRIVLPNVRRKILTQGRLVVAIWSKSALGTNTPVCKCDLDMARQHKFFEGKGGVMTFAQKLATDKKVWNNVTLYLS